MHACVCVKGPCDRQNSKTDYRTSKLQREGFMASHVDYMHYTSAHATKGAKADKKGKRKGKKDGKSFHSREKRKRDRGLLSLCLGGSRGARKGNTGRNYTHTHREKYTCIFRASVSVQKLCGRGKANFASIRWWSLRWVVKMDLHFKRSPSLRKLIRFSFVRHLLHLRIFK